MMEYLDAKLFKTMFLSGAAAINTNKDMINDLNVFPVPDGDTGTNMSMTIMSAAAEVNSLNEPDFKALAEAMSTGSLRGARGNSGVILSQILRGISKVIRSEDQIDTKIMADALKKGCDTAYKAVMMPKEGTILTVIKDTSADAISIADDTTDMIGFFELLLNSARESLDRTPDLLPVLKEAGVVDSGGMGLVTFLNGMLLALKGESDLSSLDLSSYATKANISLETDDDVDIKFGYCTEMIVLLSEKVATPRLNDFRSYLETLGDSLVFVPDKKFIKLHVHTNNPDKVIKRALTFGELSNIKIDNMRQEHREILFEKGNNGVYKEREGDTKSETAAVAAPVINEPAKNLGFVVVSSGEGFSEVFKEIGCDEIIEGGQTMNPSTEDILNHIDMVNAKNVFVFPNNKNIILACNQARDLCKDKVITVIPSTTVPQGIAAMMCYVDDEADIEALRNDMYEAIGRIKSYSLTYAVRDTRIEDKEITKGDIMALGDNGVVAVNRSIISTMGELLEQAVDENTSYISVYRGKDVDDSMNTAIVDLIKNKYPDIDIDFNYGGQPIYYYVLSVE